MKQSKNKSEYVSWEGLKRRCNNPTNKDYAARGIKVCDRWLESFENFLKDMGEKPTPKHSIDRIDSNGNYEPSNCRWATVIEQNRNKKNNIIITYKGETRNLSEWCEILKLPYKNVYVKIKRGATFLEAFENLTKHRTKILLDTETGIYYEGLADAAECLKINKGTLSGYMTGKWGNKTNLVYV